MSRLKTISSRGIWRIAEQPGLWVYKSRAGWRFKVEAPGGAPVQEAHDPSWEDFQRASRMIDCLSDRRFPTLSEALIALEIAQEQIDS